MSPWRQQHVKSFRMACAIFTNTCWIFLEQLLCTKWKSQSCLKICFSIVSINSSCFRHSVYIRRSLTLFQKQLFLCRAKTKFWNASKILSDFQTKCFPDFSCSAGACSWTCAGYLQCIFLFLHTFERSLMQSDNMLLDWPRKQDSHDGGAYYKSFIKVLENWRQLVLRHRQIFLNWTSLSKKKFFIWILKPAGKICLKASQFA